MRALLLLRGINVGGHRKLPMTTLRALLEGIGLQEVQTCVQSGNAVFALPAGAAPQGDADEAELAVQIASAIRVRCGFDCGVLVRSATDLDAIVAANPYPKAAAADPTKVHVLFLDAPVEASAVAAIDPERALPERVAAPAEAPRRVLYLRTPNGLGRAKLTPERMTRQLGGSITQRNWRTILALQAMLWGEAPPGDATDG